MLKTHVRPSRDLRNNYADIIKTLKDHDHIIITNNGVGESVLINIDDYAKYEEFLHERFIVEELQKAKKNADDPNSIYHDGVSVLTRIRQKIESR
jgi:prevent-host-death family protein